MARISKRMKSMLGVVDQNKSYDCIEAFELLQRISTVKFVESVDVAVRLGIDPRKSDQNVRGATLLPKGLGKVIRVAVFAEGDNAVKALEAGADIVGGDDLAASIKKGQFGFDVIIAMPSSMPIVGALGPILGPRGLMPNPKVGTVTQDVVGAIKRVKLGQIQYRNDKSGIIHCKLGNLKFSSEDLLANLQALIIDLKKARPNTAKGIYIKNVSLSTTMGLGICVDLNSLGI